MNPDQEFQNGLNALNKKNLNDAKEIFENLLKKHPKHAETNHLMGVTLQLQNKVDEALIYYQKTVEIKPDFAEAHKNLGNMFYRLGKIFEAEKYLKKATELKSDFSEAITTLQIISEQKKTLSKIQSSNNFNKEKKDLISNPFITTREVDKELINSIYNINSIDLDKTHDIRFGNGKCSPDLKLFDSNIENIKNLKNDLTEIMEKSVGSRILIVESFFNILSTESGTAPHKHIDPFDKAYDLTNQKFSLVYYLSTGDQNSSKPGVLKLYDPDEDILPTKGLIVIFPADRKHSSTYNGKKDRIMIGVNFYSLN
jgi:tetratricopeptide (TPR) repeat protein|tara:strand:- start:440 stop:1375 length:936 start_codon:yes stop_codon:yes gene_type:complete